MHDLSGPIIIRSIELHQFGKVRKADDLEAASTRSTLWELMSVSRRIVVSTSVNWIQPHHQGHDAIQAAVAMVDDRLRGNQAHETIPGLLHSGHNSRRGRFPAFNSSSTPAFADSVGRDPVLSHLPDDYAWQ